MHPPSAREFLHEFVGHYIALEGALWRTLKALLVPGKLTLEYFAGRRRQYVLPLRLYLTASLLFFLVVKVIAPHAEFRVVTFGEGTSATTQSTPRGGIALTCTNGSVPCEKVKARLQARYGDLSQAQLGAMVRDRLVAYSPYAMFLLLPIFAFLTRVAYWRRPRNYGEHLVFAFHVHSFAFFVGSIAAAVGIVMIETLAAAIYLALALGAVFGGRTWAKALRFLFVFLAYFLLILLAVGIIATAALFL
ncbi:hypothetical protein BWI17_08270 [Betaproteobacteria bacterium GR16-43]|nr:hypothetical protein BWI17_08270 [Betaproteobacteria bacterium GR16-43]